MYFFHLGVAFDEQGCECLCLFVIHYGCFGQPCGYGRDVGTVLSLMPRALGLDGKSQGYKHYGDYPMEVSCHVLVCVRWLQDVFCLNMCS